MLLRLHNAGEFEHVIAAIESALINGQSQPWMYEVLALSMKAADRPQEDVERVLFSRVDFTAVDVPSMLYSAAFLTRFDGFHQALRLYRQASHLEPTRPEPYMLGLKLARQLKDYDAVAWAAAGILSHCWTDDFEERHKSAENAIAEAVADLRKQGKAQQAEAVLSTVAAARQRDLVLRLTWSGDGDLDLLVEEPLGTIAMAGTGQSRGGGIVIHDGFGPKPENTYEVYVCTFGISGNYRVRIEHLSGNIVGKRARLVATRHLGTKAESAQSQVVQLQEGGTSVRITLPKGRRKELAPLNEDSKTGASADFEQKTSQRKTRPLVVPATGASLRALREFAGSPVQAQFAGPTAGNAVGAAAAGGGGLNPVGYQPVIAVIPEGVNLSAMAVISADRRYVRLTLNPVFSAISDVFTFSFMNGGGNNNATGN